MVVLLNICQGSLIGITLLNIYFFNKSNQELCSGTRLNHSNVSPYIKKRLGGSGGFRIYFLILIKKDALFLMFVHPKTGPHGSENLTDKYKAHLYKKVFNSIESKDLYKLSLNKINLQKL